MRFKEKRFFQIGIFSSENSYCRFAILEHLRNFFGTKYSYYGSDLVIRFSIISLTVSPNVSSNFLNAVFVSLFQHNCNCQFQVSSFFNTSTALPNCAQTSASRNSRAPFIFWSDCHSMKQSYLLPF